MVVAPYDRWSAWQGDSTKAHAQLPRSFCRGLSSSAKKARHSAQMKLLSSLSLPSGGDVCLLGNVTTLGDVPTEGLDAPESLLLWLHPLPPCFPSDSQIWTKFDLVHFTIFFQQVYGLRGQIKSTFLLTSPKIWHTDWKWTLLALE